MRRAHTHTHTHIHALHTLTLRHAHSNTHTTVYAASPTVLSTRWCPTSCEKKLRSSRVPKHRRWAWSQWEAHVRLLHVTTNPHRRVSYFIEHADKCHLKSYEINECFHSTLCPLSGPCVYSILFHYFFLFCSIILFHTFWFCCSHPKEPGC